jgi:hypothetical protein
LARYEGKSPTAAARHISHVVHDTARTHEIRVYAALRRIVLIVPSLARRRSRCVHSIHVYLRQTVNEGDRVEGTFPKVEAQVI